jgi:hydrogenase nickel incorporation protein HypA/HybF
MHEMGIANSVLDAVRAEAGRFPNGHIHKVGVRIGELAGVDPDAMSFCFEALVRGTDLEPLALEIEYCPRRAQCRACGHRYASSVEVPGCPECGWMEAQFLSGDELELTYLEVEDGTCAAGA